VAAVKMTITVGIDATPVIQIRADPAPVASVPQTVSTFATRRDPDPMDMRCRIGGDLMRAAEAVTIIKWP